MIVHTTKAQGSRYILTALPKICKGGIKMKFKSEADRIKYEEDYKPAYDALMKCYPFTLDAIADEVWKPIAGYDELYHVSNYGRVKSFQRYRAGKILKPALINNGYLRIHLSIDDKDKCFLVHVLAARAFIPNPEDKPEVNHDDGHKLNCYVDNLYWVTHAENIQHAFATGLQVNPQGEEHYLASITNEQAKHIRDNPDNLSQKELADMFGLTTNQVSAIQRGKSYKNAGGTVRNKIERRISDEKREQIRADAATGQYSQRELAKKHGCGKSVVHKIIHEK